MARLEVAPVAAQIIVVPWKWGNCPACHQEVMAEVHLRVSDDFELADPAAPLVGMATIGARLAHDCIPGPAR